MPTVMLVNTIYRSIKINAVHLIFFFRKMLIKIPHLFLLHTHQYKHYTVHLACTYAVGQNLELYFLNILYLKAPSKAYYNTLHDPNQILLRDSKTHPKIDYKLTAILAVNTPLKQPYVVHDLCTTQCQL